MLPLLWLKSLWAFEEPRILTHKVERPIDHRALQPCTVQFFGDGDSFPLDLFTLVNGTGLHLLFLSPHSVFLSFSSISSKSTSCSSSFCNGTFVAGLKMSEVTYSLCVRTGSLADSAANFNRHTQSWRKRVPFNMPSKSCSRSFQVSVSDQISFSLSKGALVLLVELPFLSPITHQS